MEFNQVTMSPSLYETDALLNQYLLFHYGKDQDLMPFSFGPHDSLHFPVRCVTECLNIKDLPKHAQALDLGCAVGRSSFELSRYCQRVIGVDNSKAFIHAAKHLQDKGKIDYFIAEEGGQQGMRTAQIPKGAHADRIDFRCCDVMELGSESKAYDVVLAANLICRLPDPKAFFSLLSQLVVSGGQLIISSPYSWLEEYTPRSHWLGNLESIQNLLENDFTLQKVMDLPFLIREHLRKYQWVVSQASIWKRG